MGCQESMVDTEDTVHTVDEVSGKNSSRCQTGAYENWDFC